MFALVIIIAGNPIIWRQCSLLWYYTLVLDFTLRHITQSIAVVFKNPLL